MKKLMKSVEKMECIELTQFECQQIDGGTIKSQSSFWQDMAYLAGTAVYGFVVFGTEGGTNAGISVR